MYTVILKPLSAHVRYLGSVGDISIRTQSSTLNVPLDSHKEFFGTRKLYVILINVQYLRLHTRSGDPDPSQETII